MKDADIQLIMERMEEEDRRYDLKWKVIILWLFILLFIAGLNAL